MEDYDIGYPDETSTYFPIYARDIDYHVRMILGTNSLTFKGKLENFASDEHLGPDKINFKEYDKNGTDFSCYYLKRHCGRGWFENPEEERFADTPYSYLLCEQGSSFAICGIEPRPGAIMVKQIQGFKNYNVFWNNLRYGDLFLDFLEKDFEGTGVRELWVLPFSRNQWGEVRKNFQNTKKRQYDKPAERQGFEFDEKRGIWVKELK